MNGESSVKQIHVNANDYFTPDARATYEYIVTLATFNFGQRLPGTVYTVTYGGGNKAGTLRPGESVEISDGMIFDCTRTDRA